MSIHSVWDVISKVIAVATFQHSQGLIDSSSTDRVIVYISQYEVSCGMTERISGEINDKCQFNNRKMLESRHHITFERSGQAYKYRQLSFNARGINKSYVPSFLYCQAFPSVPIPSQTPPFQTISTENATPSLQKTSGTSLTDRARSIADSDPFDAQEEEPNKNWKNENDQTLKFYRQYIEPLLLEVMDKTISKAEKKHHHKTRLLQQILNKCVDQLQTTFLPEHKQRQVELAQHVSRSVSNFLANFTTKGTRSKEESQAVKLLLVAIAGDLQNNENKITEKELREFMGIINWKKSFKTSRELREELDAMKLSGNNHMNEHNAPFPQTLNQSPIRCNLCPCCSCCSWATARPAQRAHRRPVRPADSLRPGPAQRRGGQRVHPAVLARQL
jgi:hypothetical protein